MNFESLYVTFIIHNIIFVPSKFFGSRNLTYKTRKVKNFKRLKRANKRALNLRGGRVNFKFIKT